MKTRLKISLPFLLVSSFFYITDIKRIFFFNFIAVFIHETAHIVAAKILGGTIEEIDIRIMGIRIYIPELKYISYKREIIIAIAGPASGLLTAGVTCAMARYLNTYGFEYFVGINLVISIINLIPIYPLDGGRVFRCVCYKYLSFEKANKLISLVNTMVVIIIFAFFSSLIVNNAVNPSLAIFFIYIFLCGIKFRVNP